MDEKRLTDEEEFLEIGEQKKDIITEEKKPILFDKKQYSVKLPKRVIDTIGFQDGDNLLFILIKPFDINKKPSLEIEYVRKDGTKTNSEGNIE